MFGYKIFKFNFFLLLLSPCLRAGATPSLFNAEIKKSPCRIYVQENGKTRPASPATFQVGTKIQGKPHPKTPHFVMFKQGGIFYFIEDACVRRVEPASGTQPKTSSLAQASVSPTNENQTLPRVQKWQARASLVSYQTQIKILDEAQGNFQVNTLTHALCLGAGYNVLISARFQFHADGCVLSGKADARGVGSNASNTQTYRSEGVGVFGLRSSFGVQMAALGEGVHAGLAIPILFDSVDWGTAGGAVAVEHSPLHLLGLLLTLEASRGKYSFIGEFGFLQRLNQSTGSVGIAYAL